VVALGETELLTVGATASVRKTLRFAARERAAAGAGEIGGQKEAARRRLL